MDEPGLSGPRARRDWTRVEPQSRRRGHEGAA